jgi:hypothetical protein
MPGFEVGTIWRTGRDVFGHWLAALQDRGQQRRSCFALAVSRRDSVTANRLATVSGVRIDMGQAIESFQARRGSTSSSCCAAATREDGMATSEGEAMLSELLPATGAQ